MFEEWYCACTVCHFADFNTSAYGQHPFFHQFTNGSPAFLFWQIVGAEQIFL